MLSIMWHWFRAYVEKGSEKVQERKREKEQSN